VKQSRPTHQNKMNAKGSGVLRDNRNAKKNSLEWVLRKKESRTKREKNKSQLIWVKRREKAETSSEEWGGVLQRQSNRKKNGKKTEDALG